MRRFAIVTVLCLGSFVAHSSAQACGTGGLRWRTVSDKPEAVSSPSETAVEVLKFAIRCPLSTSAILREVVFEMTKNRENRDRK